MLSFSTLISRKTSYHLLAWTCLLLAIIGAVLPLLPTTPFLLACVFFSTKVDAKLARRLIEHPKFAPAIQHWQKERSISRTNKCLATLMILVNWTVLAGLDTNSIRIIILSVIYLLVIVFIHRLPTAQRHKKKLVSNDIKLFKTL